MSANDELQAHTCEKMLEFYGNVANNVAQRNSQDLTEQWKKGKLEAGWYYITTTFTDEVFVEWFDGDEFRTVFTCNIKEVLAPVPSYEEWKEMKEQRDACAWALDKIGDILVKHKLVKKK